MRDVKNTSDIKNTTFVSTYKITKVGSYFAIIGTKKKKKKSRPSLDTNKILTYHRYGTN